MSGLEAKLELADRGAGEAVSPPELQPGAAVSPPELQPGAAVSAPPAPPVDRSRMYVNAAIYYGGVVRELVPDRARSHWTDERLTKVGEAFARCADHYGWTFAPDHPLGMLAAAAFPLVWPIAEPLVLEKLKKPGASSPPPPTGEEPPPPTGEEPPPAPSAPVQKVDPL